RSPAAGASTPAARQAPRSARRRSDGSSASGGAVAGRRADFRGRPPPTPRARAGRAASRGGSRPASGSPRAPAVPRRYCARCPMSEDVEGQVKTGELEPEGEAGRQLALAQIRQYPDPVLRMEARPVEEFDDDLQRLVERMKDLMQEANGVGLAATQVGVLRRVFVFSP